MLMPFGSVTFLKIAEEDVAQVSEPVSATPNQASKVP